MKAYNKHNKHVLVIDNVMMKVLDIIVIYFYN